MLGCARRPRGGTSPLWAGRPKKGVPRRPVAIEYVLTTEVVEQREVIDKRRRLAGCFVLLSNLPAEGKSGYPEMQG